MQGRRKSTCDWDNIQTKQDALDTCSPMALCIHEHSPSIPSWFIHSHPVVSKNLATLYTGQLSTFHSYSSDQIPGKTHYHTWNISMHYNRAISIQISYSLWEYIKPSNNQAMSWLRTTLYILPTLRSYAFGSYKCGTFKLASSKFIILNRPSPKINPLASTIIGVSLLPFHLLHHKLMSPPIVRASVKLGVLYIPTTCQ